jgi:DNA methylase
MNPVTNPAVNPALNRMPGHIPDELRDIDALTTPGGTQSDPATAPRGGELAGDHIDSADLDTVDPRRSRRADCVIVSPQPATAAALDPRDTLALAGVVSGVREIFQQLRRVLVPGGVVWLDVAAPDTVAGADVTGVAWRMALAVKADGWTLRNAIIATTSPDLGRAVGPSSGAGVRTLFLLTRERHYYFALPQRDASSSWLTPPRESGRRRPRAAGCRPELRSGAAARHTPPAMTGLCASANSSRTLSRARWNPGDVWSLPHEPDRLESCSCEPTERAGLRGAGSTATASRAIALGCPPGGLVHDPLAMCGHGPVAHAARQLGRRFQPAAPLGSTTTEAVAAGARSRCGVSR